MSSPGRDPEVTGVPIQRLTVRGKRVMYVPEDLDGTLMEIMRREKKGEREQDRFILGVK